MNKISHLVFLIVLFPTVLLGQASIILDTGMVGTTGSGPLVAPGAADPNFIFANPLGLGSGVAVPSGTSYTNPVAVSILYPAWVPNNVPQSEWIAPDENEGQNGGSPYGQYVYDYKWVVPTGTTGIMLLGGQFTGDDNVKFFIDGIALATSTSSSVLTSVTPTTLAVGGSIVYIDFVVQNVSTGPGLETGLQVTKLSLAAIPEPSQYATLCGLVLLSLIGSRRLLRRRQGEQ